MGASLSREDLQYTLPPYADGKVVTYDDQSTSTGVGERESYLKPEEGHVTAKHKDITGVWTNFLHGHGIVNGDGPCLGFRPTQDAGYQWLSYETVRQRSLNVGRALTQLSWDDEADYKFIGVYSINRIEWVLTYLGASTQNITIVPLYDTLGADAVQYCVNQTRMSVVVCDTNKKAVQMLKNSTNMPSLQTVIIIERNGEGKDEVDQAAQGTNVQIKTFADVEKDGEDLTDVGQEIASGDDLFIVCYTSGTTGNPKGVMLTHEQLLSCPHAVDLVMNKSGVNPIGPGKRAISYLPLAHIFEQALHVVTFLRGGAIGFFSGNTLRLLDDIKALKPSLFPVVPRLLGRVYDKIQANVARAGRMGQFLFKQGYASKLAKLKQGIITRDTIWDHLIFKKLQAEVGGNVEFMVTGAAPISPEVLELCRVALGCVIVEGYGQTECSAACSLTMVGDAQAGHVGPPLPCNTIRLVDVPEMNYFAKDDKGEVCIRGPNVMKGYYKEPEKTVDAIDDEGWLHTGDVGQWLPNGTLKIIDRKKHIFKLAQGEYVAPEKIENVYVRMPLVTQAFVDGDSHQRYLIAIIVPSEPECREYMKKHAASEPHDTLETMCKSETLRQHFLDEMEAFGKQAKLSSFERVKAIYLEHEQFSVENNLLTPTLKSKRPQLRAKYKEIIQKLYADNKQ